MYLITDDFMEDEE